MYLQAIAKSSASFAATANRSDSNFFDFANALHDLRSIHGFSGASTLHRTDYCLFSSSVLAELSDFVDCAVETPFARPIPRPRFESGKEIDAMNLIPRRVRARHVPEWLPELPDASKCDVVLGNGPRHGEELWENSSSKNGISGVLIENGDVEVAATKPESESVSELGARRGKVRFKIGGKGNGLDLGVNLRSGVWKGGKRVCWDNHRNRNGFKQDYINSIVGNVENI